MKILHSADIHLGAYVGPQCDDPYKRMANTLKCLDKLIETARTEQPDIILIPGDLFHQSKVWADRAMIEVRKAIEYIYVLAEIAPVCILFGTPNHDNMEHFEMMKEVFEGLDEVHIITEPELIKVNTKSGIIQVAGLPGCDKGFFRSQHPGLSAEEENIVFSQLLATIVQGLSAQVDSTLASVLMAHYTVAGCSLDNGQSVFLQSDLVLDPATLDNSNFDLVCLGHIHRAQRVKSCNKPVYYSGSIDAFTFNDEGHEKGFWMHDTNYPFMPEFIQTPAREFLTERWDDELTRQYVNGIVPSYAPGQLNNTVVRILYSCDEATEKALDKKKLERELYDAGAYYVSEIRPERISVSVNQERMHEKMTVQSCLQRYLEEKGKTAEEINEIMTAAAEFIIEVQASAPTGTTSGMFLPIEIEVRNYRSYSEEKLSFEDIYFAMVNGKNGAGKSSLFMDAITDCLYEETREGELTGWIRNGEKSGSISFTFKLGNELWRVTRTRQRSGKATLALAKLEDLGKGISYNKDFPLNWDDHSCQKLVDTQQKIIDLLGMDCETFQSCVLIMQDRYGKFMEADKEMRMAVIANLLGLGIYEQLEKLAKDSLSDVNRDIRSVKSEILDLETSVQGENVLISQKEDMSSKLETVKSDLSSCRTSLDSQKSELAKIQGYIEESGRLKVDCRQKSIILEEKQSKKAELENNVLQTGKFLEGESFILQKCSELEESKLKLAGLESKEQLLKDKKCQRADVNNKITITEIKRNKIKSQLDLISKNIQDKERLESIVEGSTIEQELEKYDDRFLRYQALNSELQTARTESLNYSAEVISHIRLQKNTIESLQKQVTMLDNSNCIDVEKANCNFLKAAKSAKKEIEDIETQLSAYEAETSVKEIELADDVDSIHFKLSDLAYDSQQHESLKSNVKIYREAKDQLGKIAADIATAEGLKIQFKELDELIQELTVESQNINVEIIELEKETSIADNLRQTINDLSGYENKKMQLPQAKQYLESTQQQVGQIAIDISDLEKSIKSILTRLEEINGLTSNKSILENNIREAEGTVHEAENQISLMNQQFGNLTAQLNVISEKKLQLEEKQNTLMEYASKAVNLSILSDAFSQDGIPFQIIRDIIPELQAAANEILGQMTAGRMSLEFITERVLKSNKNKEIATLDIIINDLDNGTLPYLSRSGGQKVRAALATNFALANIKASRVGLQLGMMFVDEPPFLDAEGVESYCSALEVIHNKYPDMRILAISHDENMKARFPQQLTVITTENGSKVVKG